MGNKTSLSLGDSLEISQVSKLHARMATSLEKSSTIELKADSVQTADTAGLQLILALKTEAETCGGKILWKNPSKALIDSAQLLGLFDYLGLNH